MPGRGAAKCFLYLLTHFPVAFVLLRKVKMNLGEQLAISVPELCQDCQVGVCRGLYPFGLPPVKPERASALAAECTTKFLDFSVN